MTRFVLAAAALALVALPACQSMTGGGPASPMSGAWRSSDGVFVANFNQSSFTSQDARTGQVLAQGSYAAAGDRIQMNWQSVRTGAQHSASCSFLTSTHLRCDQAGATSFELTRA
jgi:hypothetical protein